MKFGFRRIIGFVGAFALFLGMGVLLTVKRGNFHFYEIESNLANDVKWEVAPLGVAEQQEVDLRLNQPFYYFGSGGQSIAFLGEDNKTVLKFFKHGHLRPQLLLKLVPLPKFLEMWRLRTLLKTERNLTPIFESVLLAYRELKEETGILYLHLNKRQKQHPTVKLIDSTGYVHFLDLNGTEFLVQNRAECLLEHIDALMVQNEFVQAEKTIDTLLNSLASLMQRGIGTSDPALRRNVGFYNDQLLFFDIGSFIRDPELKKGEIAYYEIVQKTKRLSRWLKKHHPSLYTYFISEVSRYEKNSDRKLCSSSSDCIPSSDSNAAQRD